MDETINAENKEQGRQKPPLSVGRITGEILAGMASGLAVALPVGYGIGSTEKLESCFGPINRWVIFLAVFPPLYGLATAVGVYLVGNMGKQTGSFLAAFGWGFLSAYLYPFAMIFLAITTTGIVQLAGYVLILMIPPIVATLFFNLTRRYKEGPSP